MSDAARHSSPFLDTIWARLIAAAIALGGIALFLAANWDYFTAGEGQLFGDSAYEDCIEQRMAAVEVLGQEAGLTTFQLELHRQRAAAFCQERIAQ